MEYLFDFAIRIFVSNFLRYLIFAGGAFLIFYILLSKKSWLPKKIQKAYPSGKDYFREIIYSLITILIFVGIALLLFTEPVKTYTLLYSDISYYGWGYWLVSIFLMIILHDTYFYWTHRAMHHRKLFRLFHLVHHKSTNPSPWAAYAFHPLEGIIEAGIVVVIAFTIPFHISALLVFLLFMIIYNVYGHLGFELYPQNFNRSYIGKWINTSVNHNQHHKHFNGNYGLYFLFWDRIMGTIREDNDMAFDQATKRSAEVNPSHLYERSFHAQE